MPLFREDLHTRPRRVALALIAAALAGAAVQGFVGAALLHVVAPDDWPLSGAFALGLGGSLFALPFWAVGATLFGLPLLMLLRRARLCGPVSMAAAFGAISLAASFVLMGAGGAGAAGMLVQLGPSLLAGVVAGLVLRRVARVPRVTDAERIGAMEDTFR